MAWKVELSTLAQKNLGDLDPGVARRILTFLNERVAHLAEPRAFESFSDAAWVGQLRYALIQKCQDAPRYPWIKVG